MEMTLRVHHRRSIRLEGYDYSQSGAYFVTICAYKRELLFENEETKRILEREWLNTRDLRQNAVIDEFVVMPNHLHGIIMITQGVGAYCNTPLLQNRFKSPSKTVGSIIRGFKSTTTRQINLLRETPGNPIWQRNYYDHIIRNEYELNKIREYLQNNPLKWDLDKENPRRTGVDVLEEEIFQKYKK
jgi:REP element-mobilizing transposase RayT